MYLNIEEGVNVMKLFKKAVSVIVSGAAAFTLMGNTTVILSDAAFDNTAITAESTEKDTFELNGELDAERIYDGSAYIRGINKTGSTGEIIEVPVYLKLEEDLQPQSIIGIAFKIEYDHDALELVDIDEPDESAFSDGGLNTNITNGVYMYTYTIANITVDPQYPIVNLYFKVKAEQGTYNIHLANHLFKGKALQLIHTQNRQSETTYLKPYTKDISITAEKKLGKITGVKVDSSGRVTWDSAENAMYYKAVRYYKGRYYYGTATKDTSYKFVYAPDTYYQAYVLAYDSKGRCVKSETIDVNTGIGTIGEPAVDSSGNVTWDKVKYATHYRVVRITYGKPVYSKTVKDTSYSFVHVPDTDYRVMVIAYAGDGSEAASPIVTVKKA